MNDLINPGNADVATAWATMAGVAVAIAATTFALIQLRMIRADSNARTRPYVQVDVVPGLQGPGSWDLIIENTGASSAHDVIVDGGEYEAQDTADHIVPNLAKYLLQPKVLVPGARRRIMWAYSTENPTVRAGVVSPRELKVSYLGDRSRSRFRRWRNFSETFVVGDELLGAVSPAPNEGPIPTGDDQLARIDRALRTLNTHVGELRR